MATTCESGQISVATTSQTPIVAANSARRWLELRNLDGTNYVCVGGPNVTVTDGHMLLTGSAPMVLTGPAATCAIWGQAHTGAVNVSWFEADDLAGASA